MLVRKIAMFLAVLVAAFLSGWSAQGLAGGVVLAAALAGGVALPIFRDGGPGTCRRTLPRRTAQ